MKAVKHYAVFAEGRKNFLNLKHVVLVDVGFVKTVRHISVNFLLGIFVKPVRQKKERVCNFLALQIRRNFNELLGFG